MTYFWTLQRDAYNFFCRIGLLGILFGHTNRPFLFVNICRAQLGIFQREFWDSYFLSCWSWRWQKRWFSMSISIHKNQKCSYNLEFIMKIPKTFGKDDALCRTKRHIEWPTNVYSTLCSVKSMSLLQSFWTGLVYNIEMPVCRCHISVDRWKKNPSVRMQSHRYWCSIPSFSATLDMSISCIFFCSLWFMHAKT